MTWGFGWVPLALAALGTIFALRRDWRTALLLLSFIVVFWLFMGMQTRFYGRWLLPVYPFLALLAGYGVVRLASLAPPRWRTGLGIAIIAAALFQPISSIVRVDTVLAQTDTRKQARKWLVKNLPRGERAVIEAIASPGFARVREHRKAALLWPRYVMPPGRSEDIAMQLKPGLIDDYANRGFCVVVVGSIQKDRAYKDPSLVPGAIAYYERLERDARKVASFSPMKRGEPLPEFNFDWSYNYYPSGYERPGSRSTSTGCRTVSAPRRRCWRANPGGAATCRRCRRRVPSSRCRS